MFNTGSHYVATWKFDGLWDSTLATAKQHAHSSMWILFVRKAPWANWSTGMPSPMPSAWPPPMHGWVDHEHTRPRALRDPPRVHRCGAWSAICVVRDIPRWFHHDPSPGVPSRLLELVPWLWLTQLCSSSVGSFWLWCRKKLCSLASLLGEKSHMHSRAYWWYVIRCRRHQIRVEILQHQIRHKLSCLETFHDWCRHLVLEKPEAHPVTSRAYAASRKTCGFNPPLSSTQALKNIAQTLRRLSTILCVSGLACFAWTCVPSQKTNTHTQ